MKYSIYPWNRIPARLADREQVSDYACSDEYAPIATCLNMSNQKNRPTYVDKKPILDNEWNTDLSDQGRKDPDRDPQLHKLRVIVRVCEVLLILGLVFLFAARPIAILGAFLVLVAIELFFLGKFLKYIEKLTLRRTG